MILHDAYLFSKDIVSWFPLPPDLIEPVDRILDRTVANLGTKYLGLWYLPNNDETNISELLPGAKHFISDDGMILKLALTATKPCIYFNKQMKMSVFIVKNNNSHEKWVKDFGFTPAEIIYYEPAYKYRVPGKLFRSIHTP